MNVALVYDRINKYGGAERVLEALHELYPDAPLFTSVYDKSGAPWASVFDVRPSFLQHIPFAKTHHEWFPWATPMAFESFDFVEFDLVISVTSAEAKNIITHPETMHICYCLTPTRYLWSGFDEYTKQSNLLSYLAPTLKRWDLIASARPDYFIAISKRVADRIKKYYEREVEAIIYPPVDLSRMREGSFVRQSRTQDDSVFSDSKSGYFLVVSRLVVYKRIDIIIDAFNELGWPLVIIGDGRQRSALEKYANSNVTFISYHLTENELVGYYQNCRAFVYAADEDFGIAAAEAQAAGKPVIAYRNSGVGEIVDEGKTGILFPKQTKESLMEALQMFASGKQFAPELCRKNAERFSKKRFLSEFARTVERLYNTYNAL